MCIQIKYVKKKVLWSTTKRIQWFQSCLSNRNQQVYVNGGCFGFVFYVYWVSCVLLIMTLLNFLLLKILFHHYRFLFYYTVFTVVNFFVLSASFLFFPLLFPRLHEATLRFLLVDFPSLFEFFVFSFFFFCDRFIFQSHKEDIAKQATSPKSFKHRPRRELKIRQAEEYV